MEGGRVIGRERRGTNEGWLTGFGKMLGGGESIFLRGANAWMYSVGTVIIKYIFTINATHE